uniref:Secreted protein n=1 Tax=Toxocara canis TaxID=6265 RepID=A0A183U6Y6_TOXCA
LYPVIFRYDDVDSTELGRVVLVSSSAERIGLSAVLNGVDVADDSDTFIDSVSPVVPLLVEFCKVSVGVAVCDDVVVFSVVVVGGIDVDVVVGDVDLEVSIPEVSVCAVDSNEWVESDDNVVDKLAAIVVDSAGMLVETTVL